MPTWLWHGIAVHGPIWLAMALSGCLWLHSYVAIWLYGYMATAGYGCIVLYDDWNAGSHERWTKCCDLRAPPMKSRLMTVAYL